MAQRRTRLIVEIALTLALSAVLNMLALWKMPQGGTVSLGMLPLFVLALRRGLLPGLVAGVLYGPIDMFIDPFPPVHWIQPILDYPVAYLLVGLAGLAAPTLKRALDRSSRRTTILAVGLGIVLGAAGRYLAHLVSGIIFFSEYAPPGQPVWIYSALYNLYVPVSAVACLAAALVIVPALARISPLSGHDGVA